MKTTNTNNRLSLEELKAKSNVKSLNETAQKNISGGASEETWYWDADLSRWMFGRPL